jgi:hypothetical protein
MNHQTNEERPPWAAVAGLALVIAGCDLSIETSGDSGSEAGHDADTGAMSRTSASTGSDTDPEGSSTGYPPLRCQDDQTQCGDECVDLLESNEHCGACGHACSVVGLSGWCGEGACLPRRTCALAQAGHSTCASVCAQHGETCVDTEPTMPGACGGSRYGLYYDLTPDFSCESGYTGFAAVPGSCQELIRWSLVSPDGASLPGAVGCCCTQP